MSATVQPLSIRQVFQIPALRKLWVGQLVSIFGDFLALYAVISVITFRLHGTPEQVTMVSVWYLLPLVLFSPIAGVFVDRWNVKTTMIASDLVRGTLALLLLVVRDLWGLYAIFFAISVLSSFFSPAQSVTMRAIVPKEGLLSANGLMMQAMQVARIVSPMLAGSLVATFGPNSCFGIDVASFYFSALMLSQIAIRVSAGPGQAAPAGRGVGAVARELMSGMKFIFTHAAISFVILAMGAGLFVIGCFGPLIAIYVRDFLNSGSALFGALSALIGVGMIVGTMVLPKVSGGHSKQHLVLGGLAMLAVAVFLIGGVRLAAITAIGMFGMGFAVAFIVTPAQALFQLETPVDMVGRVSSSVMSVLMMAQLLGLLVSGTAAQVIGVQRLFIASGVLLVGITAFGAVRLQATSRAHEAPAR